MAKRPSVYILLASFIFIGAWFRMHGILDGSFSFTYDVGRDLLAVEDIVLQQNPTLLGPTTGVEGVFYGPWWYYVLAVPFVFTGGNPQGIAFFIALIGLLNIILGFIVGKKIGGDFLGVVCASIIAVSPFFIDTSSQIWNPNVIPTLVLLVMLGLWYVIDNQKTSRKIWFVLGLLIALIVEMEIIFGFLFGIAFIFSSIIFLRKKLATSRFAFFAVGILAIEAPRILFEIRHEFLMTKRVLAFLGETSKSTTFSIFTKANLVEIQSAFGKLWSDTLAGENELIQILLLAFFVYVSTIYYRRALPFEKFFLKFTVITFIIFIGAFAFFTEGIWRHYLIGLPILFVFFAGISLNLLRQHFSFSKVTFVLLFAILWLIINPFKFFIALSKPPWEGDEAVYRNHIAIIDYIYRESDGKEFKYVLYTPPVHDYTYRYLFSWYGKKRYNRVPSDQNAKLSFFIIEPDNVFWHRRNQWLEVRRADGKIIKEERFRWVIVQTRALN